MRPLYRYVLVLVAIIMLAGATAAHSTTYDLSTQWSGNYASENNWTVRIGTNPVNTQFTWTDISSSVSAWSYNSDYIPLWFKSPSDNPYHGGNNQALLDLLTGDVVTHAGYAVGGPGDMYGQGQGLSNVIWTSPVSGAGSVSGELWFPRHDGRWLNWDLYLNGGLLASGTVDDNSTRATPVTFNIASLSLGVGDVIELAFPAGSYQPDYVGVDLTINAVPLPPTLLLFGSGLLGLAGASRRFRKS